MLLSPTLSIAQDSPHHFQMPCETCHESVQAPKGPGEKLNDDFGNQPKVGALFMDINQACAQAGCHEFDLSVSHPLGVKPSGKIPLNMPLDQNSRLTCLSCHDELGRSDETLANPHFLRQPPGRNLCASCHQTIGKTIKEKSHWQFTNRAHLINDKQKLVFSMAVSGDYSITIGGIDSESRNCLSCHDDLATIVVGANNTTNQSRRQINIRSNHPIGMVYERSQLNSMSKLRPQMSIDPNIRFVDGRVGCGSCHNLYNNLGSVHLTV